MMKILNKPIQARSICAVCAVYSIFLTAARAEIITAAGSIAGDNGTYAVTQDLGTTAGGNLFHAFREFNLREGESAVFSGVAEIQNIIAGVSGGRGSEINGLLRSTIPGADFYLFNPAGVMFGPQARLEVPGAFHVSSADYLRLADGSEFHADSEQLSQFSAAAPAAFGFLDRTHGPIRVNSSLQVAEGQTLSLSGGDIDIRHSTLTAPAGRIQLSAVQGAAETDFTAKPLDSAGADIRLSEQSILSAENGDVLIRGGRFVADDSVIDTPARRPPSPALSRHEKGNEGGIVSLHAERIAFKHAFINAVASGDSQGSDVSLVAEEIQFHDAFIYADAYDQAHGGKLAVSGAIVTFDNAFIYAPNHGDGNGPQLMIDAGQISFRDGSLILVDAVAGSGDSGDITLRAGGDIEFIGRKTLIGSDTAGLAREKGVNLSSSAEFLISIGKGGLFAEVRHDSTGNGGNVSLSGQNITLADGAAMGIATYGPGDAGQLAVRAADKLDIAGTDSGGGVSGIFASSKSETAGMKAGRGGTVSVTAQQLALSQGGLITGSTIAANGGHSSDGGNIEIEVGGETRLQGVNPHGEYEFGFASGIYAQVTGTDTGKGGDIVLRTGTLKIEDGARIESGTDNSKPAGNIHLYVRDEAYIRGDSTDIVLLEPGLAQMDYLNRFKPTQFNQSVSGIYTESRSEDVQAGDSGHIRMQAGKITLTDNARISVRSAGGGRAGNIEIQTGTLYLADNAHIISAGSLRNSYNVTDIAQRDAAFLLRGNLVEVADGGDGRAVRYVNTGNSLALVQPVFAVTDMTELHALAEYFSIPRGAVVDVHDSGGGIPARFIYTVEQLPGTWERIDDSSVPLSFAHQQAVSQAGILTSAASPDQLPYPAGTRIHIKENDSGQNNEYVLATFFNARTQAFRSFMQRVSHFDVQDPVNLNPLAEQQRLSVGDTATAGNRHFVYTGNSWLPLGEVTHYVADQQAQNALILPPPGTMVESARPDRNGSEQFIYSGADWLPLPEIVQVADLAARDALAVPDGTVAKVADIGNGERGNFFYHQGRWQVQERGGDAGIITLASRGDIHLAEDSAISTTAMSAGGGRIVIDAGGMLELNHSEITSTVQEGYGKGGDVILQADFLIQDHGPVTARAVEGNGGNIFIITHGIYQFPPHSRSPIDASSRFGVAGEVTFTTPAQNPAGSLSIINSNFLRDMELNPDRCEISDTEVLSHFTIKNPLDGSPGAPEDLQY